MSGSPQLDQLNGLTPQQDIFIREFHLTGHVTNSALKAGCTEKNAAGQGSKWLRMPKIVQVLSTLQAEAKKNYGIDKDRIVKELMTIAYGRISDCMEWNDGVAKLKPKSQLTDEQLALIDSVSIMKQEVPTGLKDYDGNPIMETKVSLSVGSISKQKVAALKLLAQLAGMITTTPAASGKGDVFNNTQNNIIFVAEWSTGAPIKKVTE